MRAPRPLVAVAVGLSAFTAALLAAAPALAGSWAVGTTPAGIEALRLQLPRATVLVPGRVLLSRGARPRVHGASYVVNLSDSDRSLAFDNSEPDAAQQWYLTTDNAWSHWTIPPALAPVKVAVIDSGIDATHPDFGGQIAGGISFVGGTWKTDTCGHGTFVAGEIAASPFNDVGIAGMAFNAKLLIAKVVEPDCDVSTVGEIDAIMWSVRHGAQVINLSIGGIRDPKNPDLDNYSAPEEAAVEYAYAHGVLVVAAVGNGTLAPREPWPYADYPSALPHVLGVAAVNQDGAVPDYSNRDPQYVDIAAPGGPIFSTVPQNLIDTANPSCLGVPYSNCGPSEFQDAIGTSFAAPQVAGAAALLLGTDPTLTPGQVEWLIERSAADSLPATGCQMCRGGRDSYTGWGTLDVTAALDLLAKRTTLPPPDVDEPNDGPGTAAYPLPLTVAAGPVSLTATLDYWDDPIDVYALQLTRGQHLFVRLGRRLAYPTSLILWRPGTTRVTGPKAALLPNVARLGDDTSGQERLGYAVPAAGTYYLEVQAETPTRGADAYSLSVALQPS